MRSLESGLGLLCGAPGCDRMRGRRRYCDGHRKQLQRGLPLRPLGLPGGKLPGRTCYADGCKRRRNKRGRYCGACAARFYRRKRKLLRSVERAA